MQSTSATCASAASLAIRIAALLLAASPVSAGTASDLARAVVDAGLDPAECYRIRHLNFTADRAKFFFEDGYLILGPSYRWQRRITALFSTDVEGGDAEILLLPPNRAERQSLASYTGSPNLDEHISTAFLLFSPEILAHFTEQIQSNPGARKAPEMGTLFDPSFLPLARNISVQFRCAADLGSAGSRSEPRLFRGAGQR